LNEGAIARTQNRSEGWHPVGHLIPTCKTGRTAPIIAFSRSSTIYELTQCLIQDASPTLSKRASSKFAALRKLNQFNYTKSA